MMKRLLAGLLILALLTAAARAATIDTGTTLRSGSKGESVQALQARLQELGLYNKALDGIYGRGTAAAVKAFQKSCGLKADGVAGPKTLAKLNELAAPEPEAEPEDSAAEEAAGTVPAIPEYADLRSGDKGEGVSDLQTALKKLGYYTKAIDGSFGKGTLAAVQAFQKDHGLAGAGEVDQKTVDALAAALLPEEILQAEETTVPVTTPSPTPAP